MYFHVMYCKSNFYFAYALVAILSKIYLNLHVSWIMYISTFVLIITQCYTPFHHRNFPKCWRRSVFSPHPLFWDSCFSQRGLWTSPLLSPSPPPPVNVTVSWCISGHLCFSILPSLRNQCHYMIPPCRKQC